MVKCGRSRWHAFVPTAWWFVAILKKECTFTPQSRVGSGQEGMPCHDPQSGLYERLRRWLIGIDTLCVGAANPGGVDRLDLTTAHCDLGFCCPGRSVPPGGMTPSVNGKVEQVPMKGGKFSPRPNQVMRSVRDPGSYLVPSRLGAGGSDRTRPGEADESRARSSRP